MYAVLAVAPGRLVHCIPRLLGNDQFLTRIGFSNAVVATITGYQVIKSIDELLFLDDERMTNICRVI